MAFWRTNQPAAELNSGDKIGHEVVSSAIEGMYVTKGRGSVVFTEVAEDGSPIVGGQQKTFWANEPFTGM